ncbi:MAG: oligosaccharide flippase family protein [Steroidobacteraceae bacterium]
MRWNVAAAYVSQIYSALIGIVMIPQYLKYMGTEAYGLIGVFAILQICVQSLDMGITPTLSREAARSQSGATSALTLRRLLRSFEIIFLLIGALILLGATSGSSYLAIRWLNGSELSSGSIQRSLVLMAGIAWLRWFAGLYRGIVNGLQQQVWHSGVNILVSTAHSVAVIPYLIYVGSTPTHFFVYQIIISIIELAVFAAKSYALMAPVGPAERITFEIRAIRGVFSFSAVIAVTTGLWVVVTQFDKVLLSRILPLSEFGVFSLATVVAGGVTTLSLPLRLALMPRLSELEARGERRPLISVYRNATQFTTVLTFSAAIFLAVFSSKVLWVWTGNAAVAAGASTALALYALGNGVSALGAFPYYLQYAFGSLSLHLAGTIMFLVLLIPSVLLLTLRFGAPGAGAAWLGVNLAYLLIWVPFVHRRLLGRFHFDWITRDIAPIALAAAVGGYLASRLIAWPDTRPADGMILLLVACFLVSCAAGASTFARHSIRTAAARLRNATPGEGS